MTRFEDEYKERFSDRKSTEGVDSDKLWAGIQGGLAASGGASAASSGLFSVGRIALAVTAAALITGLYFHFSTEDSLLLSDEQMIGVEKVERTAQRGIESTIDSKGTSSNTTLDTESSTPDRATASSDDLDANEPEWERWSNDDPSSRSIAKNANAQSGERKVNASDPTAATSAVPSSENEVVRPLEANADGQSDRLTDVSASATKEERGRAGERAPSADGRGESVVSEPSSSSEVVDGSTASTLQDPLRYQGQSTAGVELPNTNNVGSVLNDRSGSATSGNTGVASKGPIAVDTSSQLSTTEGNSDSRLSTKIANDKGRADEQLEDGAKSDETESQSDMDRLRLHLPELGRRISRLVAGEKRVVAETADTDRKGPDEARLMIGMTYFDPGFQDKIIGLNTSPDLSGSTGSDSEFSVGVRLTWEEGILRFGTGVDIDRLHSRFEMEEVQTITVTEDGHMIGVATDSAGVQSPIYGEADFDAIQRRRVMHNNRYTVLTIPVEIGLQRSYRRFTLGVDLGVGYSLVLSQKGRAFDAEGVITDFDSSSEGLLPLPKSSFSLHATPFVDRRLTDRVSLRLAPTVRRFLSTDSPLQGDGRTTTYVSAQGGVVIDL